MSGCLFNPTHTGQHWLVDIVLCRSLPLHPIHHTEPVIKPTSSTLGHSSLLYFPLNPPTPAIWSMLTGSIFVLVQSSLCLKVTAWPTCFVRAVNGFGNNNINHTTMPLALIERDYHFEPGLLLESANMWHQYGKTCDAIQKTAANLHSALNEQTSSNIFFYRLTSAFHCISNLLLSHPIFISSHKSVSIWAFHTYKSRV